MALTYQYPLNMELSTIDQAMLASLTLDDPIFEMFPIRETQYNMVEWEQRDNYLGLQQLRGFNGAPKGVAQIGASRYKKEPGVYGEFDAIYEQELTTRAPFGSLSGIVDVTDLVAERLEKLQHRQVNRMRWILWTLVTTGVYQVTDVTGGIVDTDAFTPQLYTAPVLWSTAATSGPLADFRAIQLLSRGVSTSFGPTAKAYMTQKTLNYALANGNSADLFGRRTTGLSTIEGLADLNVLLAKDGLPQIVVYDEGYYSDANVFNLWIPDGKVVVCGTRTNKAKVGEFLLTRNVNNPGSASKPYVKVVQIGMKEDEEPAAQIRVHRGFNGGPAVYYPGSVAIMTVA